MKNQLILFLGMGVSSCFSQSNLTAPPHPEFSNFTGDVYKLPLVKHKRGKGTFTGVVDTFGKHVFDYEVIAQVDLPELDIPKTDVNKGTFPGVDRKAAFAMILESTVDIKVSGCYQFDLESDDGSILWIDDQEIINNDGNHGMQLRRDSVILQPGTYPVKVWYLQAYVTEFGLILDGKLVGKPEVCPVKESIPQEVMNFNSTVLYATGSARLREEAYSVIDTIMKKLVKSSVKKITILGHTDNIGSEEHNMQLSYARANSIKEAILERLIEEIEIEAKGRGELEPIRDNDTHEGRQANRRVEIILE